MFLYSYFNLCSTGILSMDEYIMVIPARLQCNYNNYTAILRDQYDVFNRNASISALNSLY